MESMIINRSKTIRKVQQTYTGGCRLRFSRDMQKKVRTVPIIPSEYLDCDHWMWNKWPVMLAHCPCQMKQFCILRMYLLELHPFV
ncbi:hypothetical protein T08_274 [Trichinella sp. T8]|nr:hypothetical protein T08_274 [Trichinella sp. T8]